MLSRSKICIAIGALVPVTVMAGPFSPFEARGFAMGGAGVASAEYAAATLYNPALLAVKTDSTRFSFIAPSLGVSATGNEGAFKNAQDFADNKSLDGFSDAAKAYEDALSIYQNNQSNGPALRNAATSLRNASDKLLADLQSVNQKAFQVGAGGTFAVALPRWEYKAALSLSTEAAARVTLDVAQSDLNQAGTTVQNIQQATNDIVTNTNGGINSAASQSVLDANGNLKLNGDNVASKAHVLGVAVTDIGMSMARQFAIQDQSFMVGITPKIQNIATVAKSVDIDTGDTHVNDTKKTYTGFNVDVGLAKQFEEGRLQNLRVGLVVRNLIPHTYKTIDDQDVKIAPQARIGAAYSTNYFTVTSDLDLTSNKIVGQGKDASQYVAFGAELNAWSVAKLRAGFRNDLKSKISAVTAGVSLLGLQISAAYAQDREAAVVMQFSGSF